MESPSQFAERDARSRLVANPGALGRWARGLLADPRDLPFLVLSAQITCIILPFAAYLFVPGAFRWDVAVVYLAVLFVGFIDKFILMLHNTSHRRLFRRDLSAFNHYIPWVIGPFFGETPETYYSHHVGMHHVEGNLEDDLSSTMRYQRDNPLHFAHYYLRFMTTGLVELAAYFVARKRWKRFWPMVVGELGFYVVVAGLLTWNWRPTLVVLVIPVLAVRFLMMCGNWGQHAFIDAARPDNSFVNSITCVDSRYNRRCFNDGYHIGHHLKPGMHWSEMPDAFAGMSDRYGAEGALVFRGIDFFIVWFLLMTRQYGILASRLVHCGPGAQPSIDERIALIKSRLTPIRRGLAAA